MPSVLKVFVFSLGGFFGTIVFVAIAFFIIGLCFDVDFKKDSEV